VPALITGIIKIPKDVAPYFKASASYCKMFNKHHPARKVSVKVESH